MLDAEIPALQMLLVSDDVCVAWFRGKLTSFFIRKKKGGAKYQPGYSSLLQMQLSGVQSLWEPEHQWISFLQKDQKGEGAVRTTAQGKPEKAPSSKNPFKGDICCCLVEICIVCVSVFTFYGCQNWNCASFAWEHHCWHGLLALLTVAVHLLSGPSLRSLASSLGVSAFPLF